MKKSILFIAILAVAMTVRGQSLSVNESAMIYTGPLSSDLSVAVGVGLEYTQPAYGSISVYFSTDMLLDDRRSSGEVGVLTIPSSIGLKADVRLSDNLGLFIKAGPVINQRVTTKDFTTSVGAFSSAGVTFGKYHFGCGYNSCNDTFVVSGGFKLIK